MAVNLSPIGNYQVEDSSGNPASGWKWYTYVAGSSTPAPTYTDNTGGTPQANPIVLNSLGLPANPIWLTAGASYKFVLTDASDVTKATFDTVDGINDTSVSIDQWVDSGLTPTYVSATSFTLAGDQTTAFHIGRRLKTTNSGGTIYSIITASVYAALTTITVVNDSGSLDSGLSAVSYGILTTNNTSMPALPNMGLKLLDTNASHTLTIAPGSNITANRTLTLTTGDADRTFTYSQDSGTPTLGTLTATTSGTSATFSSIPSWVTKIDVSINQISTNGTNNWTIQIGDAGGLETTGYTSAATSVGGSGSTSTTHFILTGTTVAAGLYSGIVSLVLMDASTNLWACSASIARTDSAGLHQGAGTKALTATLDRLEFASGGNTFDAGSINIRYS